MWRISSYLCHWRLIGAFYGHCSKIGLMILYRLSQNINKDIEWSTSFFIKAHQKNTHCVDCTLTLFESSNVA